MFILDRSKSDKPTFIFIKKQLSDGPYKASLGIKILPVFWDKGSERAIVIGLDRTTIVENKSINTLLDKIRQFIDSRAIDARYTSSHLTGIELTNKIQDLTGKKKRQEATDFFTYCKIIIADMEDGRLLNNRNKKYSAETAVSYYSILKTLEEFNGQLRFTDITIDFYKSFIKWCNEKDYSMNYIGLHISKLKVLMKEGGKRNYHNSISYLNADFKVLSEINDEISLSESEIEKLYTHVYENPKLDLARDWAIIDSFLGLRVSDIQLLNEKNIHGNTITVVNEKTDTKVVVPLNSKVKAIIKKWGGIPPKINKRIFQDQVKDICRLAGIDQPEIYFITKGGDRRDYYLKKYELVSPHTFRRAFITNLLNAGIPDNQVMQLAGLKRHTTLMRYKKTKPEETAEIMKKHKFFK